MRCPRCNSNVKYGAAKCRKCGLHFRYSENAESQCKRSTAAVLARLGGMLGLHRFYLGYYIDGAIRFVLFVMLCAFFIVPQLSSIFVTGLFRTGFDYIGIIGAISFVLSVFSYMLSLVEAMRLSDGTVRTDSRGLLLK